MGQTDVEASAVSGHFLYWAGDMTSFPCAEREQALAHVIADATGAAYRSGEAATAHEPVGHD
jgi:hypothetical protein